MSVTAALTGALAGAAAGAAAATLLARRGGATALIKRLNPPGCPIPMASYSQVAEITAPAPRLLYLAGHSGHDASGKLADGISAQANLCFKNIAGALTAMGLTVDDLVKINVYLTSRDDLPAYREAHNSALGSIQPASTLVIVKELAGPGMLCEIEAVAAATA